MIFIHFWVIFDKLKKTFFQHFPKKNSIYNPEVTWAADTIDKQTPPSTDMVVPVSKMFKNYPQNRGKIYVLKKNNKMFAKKAREFSYFNHTFKINGLNVPIIFIFFNNL